MRKQIFWGQVKRAIKNKGATQAATAKACGVPLSTFKGWITKDYFPTVIGAYSIAEFLGVSLDYLVTGKEKTPNKEINNALALLRKAESRLKKIPK